MAEPMCKGRVLSAKEVLDRVPQREPFRFVDEILAIDPKRVVASYRWRPESEFYRGHFPGQPVTPGVLLVESMAQSGVVPLGIYLLHRELDEGQAASFRSFFADASVEFSGVVSPGELVITESRRVFWRRRKLRVEAEMRREDGTLVCSGQLAGIGVAE
jgi:3-hydroxyacyl-[acyl-carrier-protein] dehydratase